MEDDAIGAGNEFTELIRIMDTLRGEKGCPWDRQQDERTIVNYFLEEAYELVDAIYTNDINAISEELGDMLMELVFLARLYKEKHKLLMSQVVQGINQKMIRRHPHVFGEKSINEADEVINAWSKQKTNEKMRESLFDGISQSSPALLTAFQIGLRASIHGFDWTRAQEVLEKVKEEMGELEQAISENKGEEVLHEMGDVFFALANLSRHVDVNPELALKYANQRFISRFQYIEKKLKADGKSIDDATLEEMDKLWDESKQDDS